MKKLTREPYFVPSDTLKQLRELVSKWSDLEYYFGKVLQFRVVVDTNIILGDIRWLARNRKDDSTRTVLLEAIDAGTLDIYVPATLLGEVNKYIPKIAQKHQIHLELLYQEWELYKPRLKILEPDQEYLDKYRHGVDPDDAPYIALSEQIQAMGVISRDPHISKMGGRRIALDFVFAVRDYSRAAAIEVNIKFMGLSLGLVGLKSIQVLFDATKSLAQGLAKAPDWLKVTLVLVAIFCVVHPGARNRISSLLKKALDGVQGLTPELMIHIVQAAALAQEHNQLANRHLERALSEIEVNDTK